LKNGFLVCFLLFTNLSEVFPQAGIRVLSAEKIIQLIPNKIAGFYQNVDPVGKVIKLGTIQYAVAERNFTASHKRSIKILLFDYKDAPIMYNQATKKWNTFSAVESDSLILRPALIKDCVGWESYNVYKKNSQIMLGVCNRFFLTVEGTGIELDVLKKIVQEFKFETYPK
jgi:hypothetical protein